MIIIITIIIIEWLLTFLWISLDQKLDLIGRVKSDIITSWLRLASGRVLVRCYPEHADVGSLLDVSDRDSGLHQSALKAKAAAQVECHHVGPGHPTRQQNQEVHYTSTPPLLYWALSYPHNGSVAHIVLQGHTLSDLFTGC